MIESSDSLKTNEEDRWLIARENWLYEADFLLSGFGDISGVLDFFQRPRSVVWCKRESGRHLMKIHND
jgi:hypothetical protein